MKNKIKFGLSNAHYAVITENEGAITYGTPVSIPGSVNLQLDPQGEVTPFYADNIIYYQSSTNNGYSGTFEIADIPKSFLIDIMGYQEDANGALIENSDAIPKAFALLYEVKGDAVPRKAVLYNCSVSRSSVTASTQESSSTPQTDTLNINATSRKTDKNVKAVMELSETNKAVFDKFYDAVYEPTID